MILVDRHVSGGIVRDGPLFFHSPDQREDNFKYQCHHPNQESEEKEEGHGCVAEPGRLTYQEPL